MAVDKKQENKHRIISEDSKLNKSHRTIDQVKNNQSNVGRKTTVANTVTNTHKAPDPIKKK